jgi:HEAT repeat protein
MSTSQRKQPVDEVERARNALRRAMNRLVALLGDEDRDVVERATTELLALGIRAVDPLVHALPRAKQPWHRIRIIGLLHHLGAQAPQKVGAALIRIVRKDEVPVIREAARRALLALVLAAHLMPKP